MEQRRVPRHHVMKPGTIEFEGGTVICMIRNQSLPAKFPAKFQERDCAR
jgi:hypothetical protein